MPPVKDKKKDDTAASEERLTRIAIVSTDRCRPKKCRHECKKSCPVVKCGAPPVAAPRRAAAAQPASPAHAPRSAHARRAPQASCASK
jgi:hypothetical protein